MFYFTLFSVLSSNSCIMWITGIFCIKCTDFYNVTDTVKVIIGDFPRLHWWRKTSDLSRTTDFPQLFSFLAGKNLVGFKTTVVMLCNLKYNQSAKDHPITRMSKQGKRLYNLFTIYNFSESQCTKYLYNFFFKHNQPTRTMTFSTNFINIETCDWKIVILCGQVQLIFES